MSFKHLNKFCNGSILKNVPKTYIQAVTYAKYNQKKQNLGRLVISCKHSKYDFYSEQKYDKLEEIPLASKGWGHNKSKGDYFVVHGDNANVDGPIIDFAEIGVNSELVNVLKNNGVYKATKFQTEAIPAIQSGKHVLMAAETGCGKTYAYLLPLIQNLIGEIEGDELNTPKVLILVPNRELAHQVGSVATTLAEAVNLKVKVIVGGGTKKIMMNPEFASIDILVATPGAVSKLSTVGIYKFNKVTSTVLDEADTLVDDSFIDRLQVLINRVPDSQIILSSATLPKTIPSILEPITENLVQIKSQRLHKPLLNVTQRFLRLTKSTKPSQLLQIAHKSKTPIIIFTNRNETCNWLAQFLRENSLKCSNINGDMNYNIRVEQWKDFSSGYTNILAATDVGSRGLDTTQVTHVLNYDFPLYTADYIHRIGRVGRLQSPADSKVTNFVAGIPEIKLVQNVEWAIRTNNELRHVDGNITNIVQTNILKKMRQNS